MVLGLLLAGLLLVALVRVGYLATQETPGANRTEGVLRGIIKDRRGVSLAITEEASTIAVSPPEVIDNDFTARRLEKLIGIPRQEIIERVEAHPKRLHVPLVRQLDNYVADRVMELRLPGVHRTREFRRLYPFGALAANLVGFTGRDAGNALSGLELAYNEDLVGRAAVGSGPSLQLTIDALIQRKLEEELQKGLADSQAKRAVGIVMRVTTGEVLAMAVRPSYDPNRYWEARPFNRTNWAARFNYEPGSTVKVFMAGMLLNEGLVKPGEHFNCNGSVSFGDTVVHCKYRNQVRAHGSLNMRDILRKSCNVGIITAMQRLPPDRIHAYLQRLGFGTRTEMFPDSGIETAGYLPAIQSWVPSSRYYVPIGQSFSVTPLQLIRAGASLVNGGSLVRPYVVSNVTDGTGRVLSRTKPEKMENPFRPEINAAVLDMMRSVVERGTGAGARVPGIHVAGKTGTGQKATAAGYVDRYVASFMGFFPSEKPEYAMLILFDEPRGHAGGGSLAAPVFGRVLAAIRPLIDRGVRKVQLSDLKLAPLEKKSPDTSGRMPDLRGASAREALERLPLGSDVRVFGSGYVFRQSPAPGAALVPGQRVQLFLDTN